MKIYPRPNKQKKMIQLQLISTIWDDANLEEMRLEETPWGRIREEKMARGEKKEN